MENPGIKNLGSMDIYILDQLMKNRITPDSKILDAGYGRGRNLEYFVRNSYTIYGIDHNPTYLPIVLEKVNEWDVSFCEERIITGKLEDLPYESNTFDFVFSIAVLHFATSHQQFTKMLEELLRVTKKGGFVQFRMTSWHTFDLLPKNDSGIISISDGERYMLDLDYLKAFVLDNGYSFADPIKTTNVDGHRTMTTVVIQK
jgi:ubiquinone/menaquinone biosynthesis C-methylase UbiE